MEPLLKKNQSDGQTFPLSHGTPNSIPGVNPQPRGSWTRQTPTQPVYFRPISTHLGLGRTTFLAVFRLQFCIHFRLTVCAIWPKRELLDWHLRKFSYQFYELKALTTKKQVETLLRPTPPISDREQLYLKIPRLRSLLLLIEIVSRWRWAWNIMRIIMKG